MNKVKAALEYDYTKYTQSGPINGQNQVQHPVILQTSLLMVLKSYSDLDGMLATLLLRKYTISIQEMVLMTSYNLVRVDARQPVGGIIVDKITDCRGRQTARASLKRSVKMTKESTFGSQT